MAEFKLLAGTPQVLEASGAAVNDGAWGDADDANLDNTTELAPVWDFELVAAFGANVTAWSVLQLILLPLLDGTNAADLDSADDAYMPDTLAGTFVNASNTSTARRLTIQGVALGPYKYHAYVFNQSGQQLSATWVLNAYPQLNQSTA